MSEKSPKISSEDKSNFSRKPVQGFLSREVPSIINDTPNPLKKKADIEEPQIPKPPKRRWLKLILVLIIVVIVGLGGFIFVRANNLLSKIYTGTNTDVYHKLTDIIGSQLGNKLEGESSGQVNLLLIGIGGAGHDGPYLSDTIIVAQIKPGQKQAVLTSIPRDYLTNTKEFGQRKINAIFAEEYDRTKSYDAAGNKLIETVEKMSGLDIPYFAVVDFAGFKKTVDLLGGVTVEVQNTFTDYTFPNDKDGYLPAVTFKEGTETMDGSRALIYARSRHASGNEGTDYARGKRQQQIIQAVKQKVIDLNLITDAQKINELFDVVGDHFHTNMSPGEMLRLYSLGKDINKDQISSLSLDPDTGIVCPQTLPESGAFVVSLCKGQTSEDVKNFFLQSFDNSNIKSEQPTVWIADTSLTQKGYNKAKAELEKNGMTVFKLVYTGKELKQNLIYIVNKKTSSAELIKKKFNATEVSLPPAGIKIDPSKVDLILILGNDQSS